MAQPVSKTTACLGNLIPAKGEANLVALCKMVGNGR